MQSETMQKDLVPVLSVTSPSPEAVTSPAPDFEAPSLGRTRSGILKKSALSLDIVAAASCGVCQKSFYVDAPTIQSLVKPANSAGGGRDNQEKPRETSGLLNDVALVLATGQVQTNARPEDCTTASYHIDCGTFTCEDCLNQRCENGHYYCAVCGGSMAYFYTGMLQSDMGGDDDDDDDEEDDDDDEDDDDEEEDDDFIDDESLSEESEDEDDDDSGSSESAESTDDEEDEEDDEDEEKEKREEPKKKNKSVATQDTAVVEEPPEVQKVLRSVLVQNGITSRKKQDKILAKLSNRMTSSSSSSTLAADAALEGEEGDVQDDAEFFSPENLTVSAHYADGKVSEHPFPLEVVASSSSSSTSPSPRPEKVVHRTRRRGASDEASAGNVRIDESANEFIVLPPLKRRK
jgi:hypothetical protein